MPTIRLISITRLISHRASGCSLATQIKVWTKDSLRRNSLSKRSWRRGLSWVGRKHKESNPPDLGTIILACNRDWWEDREGLQITGRPPSMRRGWIIIRALPTHPIVVTRVCFLRTASIARNKTRQLQIGSSLRNRGILFKTRPLLPLQVKKTIRESFCQMVRRQVRVGSKLLQLIRFHQSWPHRLSRTTFCPCSKVTTKSFSSRNTTKCKE